MYKCKFCFREFEKNRSLNSHKKHCINNPNRKTKFYCSICGEVLPSEIKRLHHMNISHGKLKTEHLRGGGEASGLSRLLKRTAYPELRYSHPIHWKRWVKMNGRGNVSKEFSNSFDGFKNFVDYIGEIPNGMDFPTVGRVDHSKGYERGNFSWQEYRENSRRIMVYLEYSKETQEETYKELDAFEPNRGPGNPRL
jgi:hypothetical protein